MKKSKKGKHKAKLLYSKHGIYHQVKRNLFAAKAAVRIIRVKKLLKEL
ncbi:MAG: hypothetical protein K9H65_03200 [Bacteroidales bacterium]|nr:hypothetical protein [Bacteroidales bacterium]